MKIMVDNKRKKVTRQRGNTWHGYGRGKAHHKGAGNRGGRGNAGSGKRGDAKKPSYQKANKNYFGKRGFDSKSRLSIIAINLCKLQDMIIKNNLVSPINLADLGFDKLLGSGKITTKLEVSCYFASAKAIEKIEAAGGKVNIEVSDEPSVETVEKPKSEKTKKAESKDSKK